MQVLLKRYITFIRAILCIFLIGGSAAQAENKYSSIIYSEPGVSVTKSFGFRCQNYSENVDVTVDDPTRFFDRSLLIKIADTVKSVCGAKNIAVEVYGHHKTHYLGSFVVDNRTYTIKFTGAANGELRASIVNGLPENSVDHYFPYQFGIGVGVVKSKAGKSGRYADISKYLSGKSFAFYEFESEDAIGKTLVKEDRDPKYRIEFNQDYVRIFGKNNTLIESNKTYSKIFQNNQLSPEIECFSSKILGEDCLMPVRVYDDIFPMYLAKPFTYSNGNGKLFSADAIGYLDIAAESEIAAAIDNAKNSTVSLNTASIPLLYRKEIENIFLSKAPNLDDVSLKLIFMAYVQEYNDSCMSKYSASYKVYEHTDISYSHTEYGAFRTTHFYQEYVAKKVKIKISIYDAYADVAGGLFLSLLNRWGQSADYPFTSYISLMMERSNEIKAGMQGMISSEGCQSPDLATFEKNIIKIINK